MTSTRSFHYAIVFGAALISGCGGSSNVQPGYDEFNHMNGDGATSSSSPLATINADNAYSQGYTGANQTIAIVDSSFDTNHQEISNKTTTLTTFGTIGTATHNSYHGLAVSSIAAGAKDGLGIHGVAYDANLHLSDYTYYGNQTYLPDRWAQLTNDAANHNAIVQNNSWGLQTSITDVTTHIQANNLNNAQGTAYFLNQDNYTADENSVNTYVSALDNFQNTGVIVFAISNDINFNDADFQAALPELFPTLKEAWLTVTNIEVTGTAGNYQYSREAAKCGSTAQYCIGADGEDIRTAKSGPGNDDYDDSVQGTSFAAPQVSGGLAILKQAFPNHTPKQLVERLLASAYNDFFNSSTYTTFGNGVMHYYNDEFGHGLMDLEAALAPIVVTGSPRMVTGSSLSSGNLFQTQNSQLLVSSSFGDSISSVLNNKRVYVYDDLDGGFAYPINNAISTIGTSSKQLLINHLDSTKQQLLGANNSPLATPYNANLDWQLQQPLGSATLFTSLSPTNTDVALPRVSMVWQSPRHLPTQARVEAGIHHQTAQLLDIQGSGAFNLQGATGSSSFTNLLLHHRPTANWQLDLHASAAISQLNTPQNSLVRGIQGVTSNAFSLSATRKQLLAQDQIRLQISQPHRVNSGILHLNIADLADANGHIRQQIHRLPLATSGKQTDLLLSYQLWLSNNLRLGLQHQSSLQPNHIADAATDHQQTISLQGNVFSAALGYDAKRYQSSVLLRWQGDL